MKTKKLFSSIALVAMLAVPAGLYAQTITAKTLAQAKRALNKSYYKNVTVSGDQSALVLGGTVDLYAEKLSAAKRVEKSIGKLPIENNIQVAVPEISDQKLQAKLLNDIQYSRVGYGTTPFNAISVEVHDGVVLLGGSAWGPVDASTAFNLATNTKGVREVINHITVDPTSPMDDRIRRMEYRSIYGFPQLNRYALNPLKPIRIVVQNGHVTLEGVVDSASDKTVAGIRANSVPGVFSVVNNLRVAGQE